MKALAGSGFRPFHLWLALGALSWLGSVGAEPVRLTASQASVDAVADYLAGLGEQPAWWDANGDQQCDVADIVSLINTSLGLSIQNLTWDYSTPYLLDFNFTLRDQNDHSVQVPPKVFQVQALENGQPISRTETGFQLVGAASKQMRSMVVLDYTGSMADIVTNGDSDGDGISDAIETMEEAAKVIFESVNEDAQIGIVEFHNHMPPELVAEFTSNREYLSSQVDRIWTDYVQMNPGETRVWDAVYRSIEAFRAETRTDEQRFVIFLTDGDDTSSVHTSGDVVSLALARGVRLYCIGFGADLKPAVLRTITAATDGRYYEAGSSVEELRRSFEAIIRDLGGQYTLRWATLRRRADESFIPSFEIRLLSALATAEASEEYVPTDYTGNVGRGVLRFVGSPAVNDRSTVYLRADYVPRNIRHIRLRFRSFFPFRIQKVVSFSGGLIADWDVTTADLGSHEFQIDMVSPNSVPIPYASFGPLLRFQFWNIPSLNALFALPGDVWVDNSIYALTGKQSFAIQNLQPVFNRNLWESSFPGAEEVVATDMDHDGWQDVIAAAANAGIVAYWRSGDCPSYMRRNLNAGIGLNSLGFDGYSIIAASPITQLFYIYAPKSSVTCPDNSTEELWVPDAINLLPLPGNIYGGAADIDGDGDIDYVGASAETGQVFWRERRGQSLGVRIIDASFPGVSTVAVVDVDQDGAYDVVAASLTTGEIAWWRFNRVTELWTKSVIATGFVGVNQVKPVDLDRDGDIDLLGISPTGETVEWWENNGHLSFTGRVINNGSPGIETIDWGDFDADGDLDFVGCSRGMDSIWLYENDGFQVFTRYTVADDYDETSCVAFGDFDRDGDLDIWATGHGPFEDGIVWYRVDRAFQW